MPPPRTPAVAQLLVDAYITGLRQRLPTLCLQQLDKVPAANEAQLHHLCQAYPNAPIELIYLLQRFNGSNWERYSGSNTSNANSASKTASPSQPTQQAPATTMTSDVSAEATTPQPTPISTTTTTSNTTTTATSNGSASKVTTTAAKFLKQTLVGKPPKKCVPSIAGSGPMPGLYAKREKTAVPVLGSALESCPYFLRSVEQILGPQSLLNSRTIAMEMTSIAQAVMGNSNSATETSTQSATQGTNGASLNAREWSEPRNLKTLYAEYEMVTLGPSVPIAAAAAEAVPIATQAKETSTPATPTAEKVKPAVLVDPRIDTQADLSNWLEFAESIHFELLPQAPTPDTGNTTTPTTNAAQSESATKAEAVQGEKKTATETTLTVQQQPGGNTGSDSVTQPYIESHLFVDFKPAEARGGVVGQVIQYVRNSPDSFTVIAENFGDYLKHLIAEEYQFTEILDDDDDEEEGEEVSKAAAVAAAEKSTKSNGNSEGNEKKKGEADTPAEANKPQPQGEAAKP